MIELPEAETIEKQANELLKAKTVKKTIEGNSPHKFCFFNGDFSDYNKNLRGKTFTKAQGHGMYADLLFEDLMITVNDGVNCRLTSELFKKYQYAIEFSDGTYLVFTVAMYGGICVSKDGWDNFYYLNSKKSVSPLLDGFDFNYFENLFKNCKKDYSLKAFLATEQRIPGLGNGCLQDILFNAKIHPKRKMKSLKSGEFENLFFSVKKTLSEMTEKGGRDTEKDLTGNYGGYRTILSKNTILLPCSVCGERIIKEAYLGGAVYYCPCCQK